MSADPRIDACIGRQAEFARPILTCPAPVAREVAEPHRLAFADDGHLSWDGRGVADSALPSLLATAKRRDGDATLHLQTDPATRCERFDEVLAVVKLAGIARLGFIGHERMVF